MSFKGYFPNPPKITKNRSQATKEWPILHSNSVSVTSARSRNHSAVSDPTDSDLTSEKSLDPCPPMKKNLGPIAHAPKSALTQGIYPLVP